MKFSIEIIINYQKYSDEYFYLNWREKKWQKQILIELKFEQNT